MTGDTTSGDRRTDTASVDWRQLPPADCPEPLVRETAYVECKLEHSDLESTEFGDSFFTDAVPYRAESGHRIFYWRPVLDRSTETWTGVCATPETLRPIPPDDRARLDLADQRSDVTRIVVDGTVAGDSTAARVRSYSAPKVCVESIGPNRCRLRVGDETHVFSAGTRTTIAFPEQRVRPGPAFETERTVTPRLSVRFPGLRTLCHPPTVGECRLFPSFGLSLDQLSNPLSIPCRHGELDYDALAEKLDVDLSARPYPVRVLWQAFAYTAFDPHREIVPEIGSNGNEYLLIR